MNIEELKKKAFHYEFNEEINIEKENKRQEFIKRFPLESLATMSVKEYADMSTKDCFTYWLEYKETLGGSAGGNASKFGIYAKNGQYFKGAADKKEQLTGELLENEFNQLRDQIVTNIRLAQEDRVDEIDYENLKVWSIVMLKILNLYFPDKFFNIYTGPVIEAIAKDLNVSDEILNKKGKKNHILIQYLAYKKLREIEPFNSWHYVKLSEFLWENYKQYGNGNKKRPDHWLIEYLYGEQEFLSTYKVRNIISLPILNQDLTSHIISDDLEEPIKEIQVEKEKKLLEDFLSLKKGDVVAVKTTYSEKKDDKKLTYILKVVAIGQITENLVDGYKYDEKLGHTLPVQWLDFNERNLPDYGGFRDSIHGITKKKDIKAIFEPIVKGPVEMNDPDLTKTNNNQGPLNVIFYGPPGTGKTYNIANRVVEIFEESTEDINVNTYFKELQNQEQVLFVTFHQNFSYEDFVEGLRSDKNGRFVPSDGVLKRIAIEALYEGLVNKQNEIDYKERKKL